MPSLFSEQASHQTALAYDRLQRNPRPVFALQHSLTAAPDGLHLTRVWRAVGDAALATETVHWQQGLLQVEATQPTLAETALARMEGSRVQTLLTSHQTNALPRERWLDLPYPAVTLSAMPLFIAQHWEALRVGETRLASYLVLKVQRAATVRVERAESRGAAGNRLVVGVTPTNPLLRWIFGSTLYELHSERPELLAIDGLLDPRDLKPNGRWREYLGRIEFAGPVDLSLALAAPALGSGSRS